MTVKISLKGYFPYLHWNVFVLMKFWSLAAPEVVKMTTSSAASDQNVIKMSTVPFQYWLVVFLDTLWVNRHYKCVYIKCVCFSVRKLFWCIHIVTSKVKQCVTIRHIFHSRLRGVFGKSLVSVTHCDCHGDWLSMETGRCVPQVLFTPDMSAP